MAQTKNTFWKVVNGKRTWFDSTGKQLHIKNKCLIETCNNDEYCKKYCRSHYRKLMTHGDAKYIYVPKNPSGSGWIDDAGYKTIRVDGKNIKEHRYLYEQYIGRKLFPNENVHHKNGNRSDNRLENLELWITMQPSGQRPEDLVVYAKEILKQYENIDYDTYNWEII